MVHGFRTASGCFCAPGSFEFWDCRARDFERRRGAEHQRRPPTPGPAEARSEAEGSLLQTQKFEGRGWRGAVRWCTGLDPEGSSPRLRDPPRLRVKTAAQIFRCRSLDSLRSLGMTQAVPSAKGSDTFGLCPQDLPPGSGPEKNPFARRAEPHIHAGSATADLPGPIGAPTTILPHVPPQRLESLWKEIRSRI